ncbi:MAG: FadR family transcriptional regulator, partial [Halioglobus sp.]|nr:FadR family transcriptional regulator [Halioglobus sp.]
RGGPTSLAETADPGPFEILEARKLIEGETCALAAERISDAQLQQLSELVEAMAEENRQEAVTEEADGRFHCLIAEAAGNSALTAAITWLWQLRNESEISTHFHRRLREEGDRPIVADHQKILDALHARNPAASRQAMVDHLQRVIDHLLEVL